MASIPCAAYQAGKIHGNMKKAERARSNSEGFVKAPNFSFSSPGSSSSSSCSSSGRSSPAQRGAFGSLNFHFQFPSLPLRSRSSTWSDSSSERCKTIRENSMSGGSK